MRRPFITDKESGNEITVGRYAILSFEDAVKGLTAPEPALKDLALHGIALTKFLDEMIKPYVVDVLFERTVQFPVEHLGKMVLVIEELLCKQVERNFFAEMIVDI